MIKILLVEDDLSLSNSVYDFLEIIIDVVQALMATRAYMKAQKWIFMISFYLTLCCQKNGFEVLAELRAKGVNVCFNHD